MRVDLGLDWREPGDYEYTKGLRAHQWAWEFLRRRSDYQDAWKRFSRGIRVSAHGLGQGATIDFSKELEVFNRTFHLMVPAPPTQTAIELGASLRWVMALSSQESGAGVSILANWNPLPAEPPLWPGGPVYAALRFCFLLPDDAQLEAARKVLAECRQILESQGLKPVEPPKVKFSSERFTLYLRLLDAEEAEATVTKRAQVLFPGKADSKRSAQLALQSAHKQRDDYRALLFRAD